MKACHELMKLLERKKWNIYQKQKLANGLSKYKEYFRRCLLRVADAVRSEVSFVIVAKTLHFLPLCSTLFEGGYHNADYFSDSYKEWIIKHYAKEMLRRALNPHYVQNWMIEKCKIQRCMAAFGPTLETVASVLRRCIKFQRLHSANYILELYGHVEFPDYNRVDFIYDIFETHNLAFIKQNLQYCGVSENGQCENQEDAPLRHALYTAMERSCREVFEFFFAYVPLGYARQIEIAMLNCDLDYLNDIAANTVLTWPKNRAYMTLDAPTHADTTKVLGVLQWLRDHNHPIFDTKNFPCVRNVESIVIADFLHAHGIEIQGGTQWMRTEEYINWCVTNQQKMDWVGFIFDRTKSVLEIVSCLERYKQHDNMKTIVNYLEEHRVVQCVDLSLLKRLENLGFDFARVEYFTLGIFGPSLVFLQFLRSRYVDNTFFMKRQARELYSTSDLQIHEYAYEIGLYSHDTSRKCVRFDYPDDETERKFDMWSYAFETQNVALLNWVVSKNYKKPNRIIYPCPLKDLSSEFLNWVWTVFFQKIPERLLEMTLYEDSAFIPSGDWAYHLYQKETGHSDTQTQHVRSDIGRKLQFGDNLQPWKCLF